MTSSSGIAGTEGGGLRRRVPLLLYTIYCILYIYIYVCVCVCVCVDAFLVRNRGHGWRGPAETCGCKSSADNK